MTSSGGGQLVQLGEQQTGPGADDEAGAGAGAEAQRAHQPEPGLHRRQARPRQPGGAGGESNFYFSLRFLLYSACYKMFEIKFEFEFTFSVGVSVSELDRVSGSRLSNHRSPAGPRADGAGGQGVPPGRADISLSLSSSLSLSL